MCGRWNDGGGSQRSVTAGPASTWFEAHCIVWRRTLGCADPPAVEAHPAAGSSRDFLHWGPAPDLPSRADRRDARYPRDVIESRFGLPMHVVSLVLRRIPAQ